MKEEIWASSALTNGQLSNKLGIRAKYYGHDWEEPTHRVPPEPNGVFANMERQLRGETLRREDFPEACYVFDPGRFKKTKDFFFLGGFAAVKGKLADILTKSNLGKGGLVEVPVFEADRETPIPGPFYALNFARCEGLFAPQDSKHIHPIFTLADDGIELWDSYAEADYDFAVSSSAYNESVGLCVDPKLKYIIFFSGSLVEAIKSADLGVDYLRLFRCKVID